MKEGKTNNQKSIFLPNIYIYEYNCYHYIIIVIIEYVLFFFLSKLSNLKIFLVFFEKFFFYI